MKKITLKEENDRIKQMMGINSDRSFDRLSPREMEEENELGRITDMVEKVFEQDSLTSSNEVDALAEDIRNLWAKTRNYGNGDERDFVREYLTDWASNVRHKHHSMHEKPSLGSHDDENTIWGDNWKHVINRACEYDEPSDDQIFNNSGMEGGISHNSEKWQGRTNPDLQQEEANPEEEQAAKQQLNKVLSMFTLLKDFTEEGIFMKDEYSEMVGAIHRAMLRWKKKEIDAT